MTHFSQDNKMNGDIHFSNICETPIGWTDGTKWIESCTIQPVTKQANNNDILVPFIIVTLPILLIFFWKIGIFYQKRSRLNKAIAHLQKIILLERILIKTDKSNK
jgi:hypothetical protein